MNLSFQLLRDETLGNDYGFNTPYGERILTYADYTASVRSLKFIEKYMLEIQKCYANTHTEYKNSINNSNKNLEIIALNINSLEVNK